MTLDGRKIMITGATRGLGRALAETAAAANAEVWAIGRNTADLESLSAHSNKIHPLRLDITADDAATKAFDTAVPDILILSAGAIPRMAPVRDQTWAEFSTNWETDVKGAFTFGKAALARPMPDGGIVLTISSGAAIGGSFASGGYAGAKRMQWFLSQYLQREADELERRIKFLTVLPKQQFRETELGQTASSGYADRIGIAQDDFLARFKNALTPQGFADSVVAVLTEPHYADGHTFAVSGAGIERMD